MKIKNRAARLLTVGALAAASATTGLVAQSALPAFAADTCTGAGTGSQAWHTGTTQRLKEGYGAIVFSFFTSTGCSSAVLPGGANANLSMRVSFCSGGGGTSGGSTFTTVTAQSIAVTVLDGACFQTQWRPNNAATDYENFHGKLIW